MKFFHLSDVHIGLKLMNRDLLEDQRYIFQQVTALAEREQPDAIVIAGDIYDKAVPSAEAVGLFDELIVGLRMAVPRAAIMLISGNHDSAPRVNCFRSVLCAQNLYMIGMRLFMDWNERWGSVLSRLRGHLWTGSFLSATVCASVHGKINSRNRRERCQFFL